MLNESKRKETTEAKEYLRKWKDERSSWKFNKTKQTWLLKNLFHKGQCSRQSLVPEEYESSNIFSYRFS